MLRLSTVLGIGTTLGSFQFSYLVELLNLLEISVFLPFCLLKVATGFITIDVSKFAYISVSQSHFEVHIT